MAAEGPRGGLKRSLRSTVKSMLWCARLLEMQLCLRFCTVRIWISFDSVVSRRRLPLCPVALKRLFGRSAASHSRSSFT